MKKIIVALLLLPLLALATGCASQPKKEEVDRFSIIEQQLAGVLAQLNQMQTQQRANATAVQQLREDVQEELTNIRSESAKSGVQLDTLQRRIDALSERIADAELRLTNVNKEVTSMKIQRSGTVYARPSGTEENYDYETSGEGGDSTLADPTMQPGTETVAGQNGSDTEMYQVAYSDYLRSDFNLAAAGFRRYLQAWPAGSRVEEASFYLAESLFSLGEFTDAVEAYDQFLQRFPESQNQINAMYKKGLAFLESNQTAQGVILLQQLVSRYPNAIEARLAREKLRNLGLNP